MSRSRDLGEGSVDLNRSNTLTYEINLCAFNFEREGKI